ncbi:hypothetical protein M427DRAFT_45224 [Gonapodya prolifera JEL478]|uniref:Uncharacterized protein n=1 Tax=Gonapodya prolifera (strain JEL478) TaxID=1344416 RepID=A0A139ABV6_GONPJ|nr:hypothetical protein M427DRAFT_45224 [Gonapodya prolifera JEL478]|eukprot:KXS14139.1 hypothetical protein M427DRAFT_45224 [Gonapodya prolifera JEL478]
MAAVTIQEMRDIFARAMRGIRRVRSPNCRTATTRGMKIIGTNSSLSGANTVRAAVTHLQSEIPPPSSNDQILHRIFRLLPPSVFYRVLPLLSKRIGSAARTALPGSSDGAVRVLCSVVIRLVDNLRDYYPDPVSPVLPVSPRGSKNPLRFLPRFETKPTSRQPHIRRVFWAGCEAEVTVAMWRLSEIGYNVGELIWRQLRAGGTWDNSTGERLTLGGRQCELSIITMTFDPFFRVHLSGEEEWRTIRTFGMSQYCKDMRSVKLHNLTTWLREPQGDTSSDFGVWSRVMYLEVERIAGTLSSEEGSRTLVNLMKSFPFATNLRGLCLLDEFWDADVQQHVPMEQRSRIRSVLVTPKQAKALREWSSAEWPHALLYMFRTFPKISEFGVISLGSSRSYHLVRPRFPLRGEEAFPSTVLPDLTTLHTQIESSSSNQGLALPGDVLSTLEWIRDYLPNLTSVFLTFLVIVENRGFTSEQRYFQMAEKVSGQVDIMLGDITYQTEHNQVITVVGPNGIPKDLPATKARLATLRPAVEQLGKKAGVNIHQYAE